MRTPHSPLSWLSWLSWPTLCFLAAVPMVAAHGHTQIILPSAALALVGLMRIWRAEGIGAWTRRTLTFPLTYCFLGLIAWGLLSLWWTPTPPGKAFLPVFNVAITALAGAWLWRALSPESPTDLVARHGATALGAGLVAAVASMPLPWLLGSRESFSFLPYNAGMSVASLLLGGAVLGLIRRGAWGGALALAGVMIPVIFLGDSEATKSALAAGLILAALAGAGIGAAFLLRLVLWGLVPVFAGLPWLIQRFATDAVVQALAPGLPYSLQHRLAIWRFTSERIVEHPWAGWGAGAVRSFGGAPRETAFYEPGVGWVSRVVETLPLHPHSMPLHLWLDLGAVGVGFVVAGLLWGGWVLGEAVRQRPRLERAVLVGVVTIAAVMVLGSYSAFQAWVLTMLYLAAACLGLGGVPLSRR